MRRLARFRIFLLLCFMTHMRELYAQDGLSGYTVTCYYYPNFHSGNVNNARKYGAAYTEWDVVKNAKPRFPGHRQPLRPLWGYTNETDPVVMEQKISAAAQYGIDVFIFDWYYDENGPNLEEALEQGYLKAGNRNKVKFAIMWANEKTTPATFDKIMDYVISRYFKQPGYWKVNGCPYFSIYDIAKFNQTFGGQKATKAVLDKFREKVKAAGFPDLHLNVVLNGVPVQPGTTTGQNAAGFAVYLGVNSLTSYVWVHNVSLPSFPATSYSDVADEYITKFYPAVKQQYSSIPYYPNITMGWDPSPRCKEQGLYKNQGYPCMAVIKDNTPASFRSALQRIKQLLDNAAPKDRIITVNSWNEWTEGSYLEPESRYGFGYLQQINRVLGK